MAEDELNLCELEGHLPEGRWTLRPALVGAGVSIERVHYDRRCLRQGGQPHQAQIEWREIVGPRTPRRRAMRLLEWLAVNKAAIANPPAGPVDVPDQATAAVLGNRAQRRASTRRT